MALSRLAPSAKSASGGRAGGRAEGQKIASGLEWQTCLPCSVMIMNRIIYFGGKLRL